MQDDRHIATLLGLSGIIQDEENLFGTQKDLGERHNFKLTDVLLKTLLRNLSYHVVCKAISLAICSFVVLVYEFGYKIQVIIIVIE